MKRRILLGMCMVALISVLITSLFSVLLVFEDARATLKEQIIIETDYVKTAYENLGVSYLESLNKTIGGRITVIDKDGKVIYDSVADAATLENHMNREEIKSALKDGIGSTTRYSASIRQETHYYAVRLADGGVIRVASTIGTVYAAMISLVPWVIAIVIAALIIAVLIANIETKRIVNPINSLNLDSPKENDIYEEFSPLLVRMEKQRQQIKSQMTELTEKQNEFTTITKNMSEGLILVDKKATVLSYNTGALKLCACHDRDVTGESVFAVNHDIDFCRAVESALIGIGSEYKQKIGGRICRFFINPVYGESSGAIIVIMDVTEKENREELRREFTANVSHELKTPLTSISGYAEIIKNGIAKKEDIPNFADKIYVETQRLIELVADIIKLSRLDEADDSLEREECDLYLLSENVVKRLNATAKAAGIRLSVNGISTEINGVSTMLEEMICNLCNNAIKYNTPGGLVTVSVENLGDKATLTVSDTGIGIPEEDRDRIFERFYRVDKSHSKGSGGTGLGLSIVKHCAQLHGGEIILDSILGKGTQVKIVFKRS